MKRLGFPLLLSLVLVISLSVTTVSALGANDAIVIGHISNSSPNPGDAIYVTVTFQSYINESIRVLRVGLHGDWMGDQEFQGPNLINNPETVQGKGSYTTQFLVIIPTSVALGSHNYYVGVDGADQMGNTYSWDSNQYTLQVVSGSNTGSPTPTSTSNGGQPNDNGDWLPYLAVVAAAVIVVLLIVLTIISKKKKSQTTKSQPTTDQAIESNPEQPKPEDTSSPEEFTI